MNRQLTFTRFDLGHLADQPRQYVVAFAFVTIVALASPISTLALPAAGIIVGLMAATTFALDERGRLDTLYATLPTSRSAAVVGRYTTVMTLWAAVTAVAVLATTIAPLVRGRSFESGLLLPMVIAGFGIVAFTLSLQLPLFFAIGYTKAKPFRYVPVAIVTIPVWIIGQLGLIPPEAAAGPGSAPVLIGTVVGGVVLLLASAGVASLAYARRQL